jgi:hypothetical protein
MDENLRLRILGDSTGAVDAIKKVEVAARASAETIGGIYERMGSILKGAIGFAGVGLALEKGLDLASKQQSLQAVQTQLLQNQGLIGQSFLGTMVQQVGSSKKYSSELDKQATTLSLQTGLAKNAYIQAQNLLLPNQDLSKLWIKNKDNLQLATLTAGNLAEVMGTGAGGVTSSARMLARSLADPAKHMSSMTRYGVTLSLEEQKRIKSVEKTNGLLAAQQLFLQDINKHVKGTAQASIAPIDQLKNTISLFMQDIGMGFLPILDSLVASLDPFIKAFEPIMQGFAKGIASISESLGSSLGNVLTAFVPIIDVFTQGVLPALLSMLVPILKLVGDVTKIFVDQLGGLTGTAGVLGAISAIFVKMGLAVSKNLMIAVKQLTDSFQQMANNGTLKAFLDSIVTSLTALAPILPALANIFAQFLTALIPAIPVFTQMLTLMINAFAWLAGKGSTAITFISQNLGVLSGIIKVLAVPLAALAAVWFTKGLFLTPIELMVGGIGKVGRSLGTLKSLMGGMRGVAGDVFGSQSGNGLRGGFASRVSAPMERIGGILKEREAGRLANLVSRGKITEEEYSKRLASGAGSRLLGKSNSLFSSILGGNLTGMSSPLPKNQLDATNKNTQALHGLTTKLGGGYSFGGSNSPLGGVTGALEKSATKSGFFSKLSGGLLKAGGSTLGRGAIGAVAGLAVSALVPQLQKIMPKSVANVAGGVMSGAAAGSMFGAPGMLIGGAIGGITQLYKNFKPFRDLVHEVFNVFKKIGGYLKDGISFYIKGIGIEFKIVKTIVMDIWKAIKFMWDGLVGGAKMAWGIVTGVFNAITNAASSVWNAFYNGFVTVANAIIGVYDATIGWIPGMHVNKLKPVGPGNTKPKGKMHSGGIVPGMTGREVPMMLQAGEAVMSINQVRNANRGGNGAGNTLNIHPNAFSVTVNGSADAHVTAQIKTHVDAQFQELHRTLRAMGR